MESDQGSVQVRWTGTLIPEGAVTKVKFAFDVDTGGLARLFAGKIRGAMGAAVPSNMEALRRHLEGTAGTRAPGAAAAAAP
jgi:carbon monoxide dehydrogenase subunit G